MPVMYYVLRIANAGQCHSSIVLSLAIMSSFQILNMSKIVINAMSQGLGSDCISRAHSAVSWKLGTALQAYTLNPCTKFPQNPTSRKVNA